MGRTQSLSPDEAARVVEAVRELLASEKYDNNQSTLAPDIGIAQPTLSQMLGGKHVPGYGLARQVAKVAGRSVEELLGTSVDFEPGENRAYPVSALGNRPEWPELKRQLLAGRKRVNPHLLEEVAHMQFSNAPEQVLLGFVFKQYDAAIELYGEDYAGPPKTNGSK